MRVVPYDSKYKNDFIEMNKAWISKMFAMEPEDERELGNIEPYVEKGGQIFFALDEEEKVMACCMIAPREDGDWEIMKFAARGMYTVPVPEVHVSRRALITLRDCICLKSLLFPIACVLMQSIFIENSDLKKSLWIKNASHLNAQILHLR
ncbi:MAG: hypothetical protein V8S08_12430 [Lachnoclostridium sp.]